jgi:thiamine-monophosphate kinase
MRSEAGVEPSASATVADLSERDLVARIERHLPPAPDWLLVGIGDDAAVVEPERNRVEVLSVDALVEGVHFDRAFVPPDAIGHRALAVNLSDLAAMGAEPRGLLLSLALPPHLDVHAFDELIGGFADLADRVGAPLVGGNITRSPGPLVVDVTAIGSAHPRQVLTRSGGRPGHELYLTGAIGAAAAGLEMLLADRTEVGPDSAAAACLERHRRPEPRLHFGIQVSRNRAASACVDLSDGLADAVRQLAAAGGTGAALESSAVPVHAGAAAWTASLGQDPLLSALSGGEDYELLFAVPSKRRAAFLAVARRAGKLPVTRVGRLTAEPGCWLEAAGRRDPLPEGFVHF